MGSSYWMQDQNGNFSNEKKDTFDEAKGYVGLRLQMGVPLLDRDWNELEDIRRYNEVMLRRHYIGDGTPDDGFKILPLDDPGNGFMIQKGHILVKGMEAVNPSDISYSEQEGVSALTVPSTDRTDKVYIDVWIEEIIPESGDMDNPLNNPQDIKMATCIRHKLFWKVLVAEGVDIPDEDYHWRYQLATISRSAGKSIIEKGDIVDNRRECGTSSSLGDALKVVDTLDVAIAGNLGTHGYLPHPRTPGWKGGLHTHDIEAEGTIWSRHGLETEPRDLAELFPSSQGLQPGDVVCLSPDGGLARSDKQNDTRVAGVVSTEPAIVLGFDPASKQLFPLALAGRVPCKVVDENGPIRPGDLLTSSSTPGHAMRASSISIGDVEIHRPGTIIGKALGSLEGGEGIVDLLIMPC